MSQSSAGSAYLEDLNLLSKLPASKRHAAIHLEDYPFDLQLLTSSSLYRRSRAHYLELGGKFLPRMSSTMRSLSAHDLFRDEIEFSPAYTEMLWFRDHPEDVSDPEAQMQALIRFSDISLFHEQNHRIIWQLLPPPPPEERDMQRYLNFAESLVVALDLALGDQIGKKHSGAFERMKVIYRDAGNDGWINKTKAVYRDYLLAALCATYFSLELMHDDDILAAVQYVLPQPKRLNRAAVERAFGLSELFTRVTNPQWQDRNWKSSYRKLMKIHQDNDQAPLYLPEDPLDLEEEFLLAKSVLSYFGL